MIASPIAVPAMLQSTELRVLLDRLQHRRALPEQSEPHRLAFAAKPSVSTSSSEARDLDPGEFAD